MLVSLVLITLLCLTVSSSAGVLIWRPECYISLSVLQLVRWAYGISSNTGPASNQLRFVQAERALTAFEQMQAEGIAPNLVTMNTSPRSRARLRSWEHETCLAVSRETSAGRSLIKRSSMKAICANSA